MEYLNDVSPYDLNDLTDVWYTPDEFTCDTDYERIEELGDILTDTFRLDIQ